jgi:hypothetical protein
LGEIVPQTDEEEHENIWIMRGITVTNVLVVFFINDFIDSSENFKLL